ncbi:MAG: hypothetical protein A2W91_13325 [Bacteroidetes bacterium GWF2_38_335]|nr:MAG: hypothetical protein A2W91_13325 [Bacteroidetes bacterium GWF2_38_335]OFY77236.1 MAG: hypothetical protein A2281_14990 [Bacteroidetes bacterium RIFOXYA12_FULL_38_20]HBS85763.1 hypothetical protein [Bacteroidales bacterium]
MRVSATLFFLLLTWLSYSQVYQYYDKGKSVFLKINGDSAKLQSFGRYYPHFYFQVSDDILKKSVKGKDTLYSNENVCLKISGDWIRIKTTKGKKTKTRTRFLYHCKISDLDFYRINVYLSKIQSPLYQLFDSLSVDRKALDSNLIKRQNILKSLKYDDFIKQADGFYDSLRLNYISNRNTITDVYYNATDSILLLDSARIISLFEKADYNHYCCRFFLHQCALQRPDCLIYFAEKDTPARKSFLKAIRNHRNYREIIKKVKETPIESKGKKLILRQKSTRVISDVAIATAGVILVLSNISLMVLLCIWIF